ncbi:RNA-guided pseudouridylation complex pseudouridine synthase subunit Cbf5 [archaeon]|nr:RNA-guided pseudouridylation complex pseudouridine synthase subunit Cbf5 [archaeon]
MEEFLSRSHGISSCGQNPGSRPVEELIRNGIIILDKWSGPTTHDVSATVKKILGLKKVGSSGTLDPGVTGVLPITLENACKIIPALQHLDKEYVGIMQLHKDVDDIELKKVVNSFVGRIKQRPPVRSAVARRERERTVYSMEIIEKEQRNVLFKIRCEAGTYVRVVCHQIGTKIGGAHMKELRRTEVGRFSESDCVKIQDLADAYYEWKESRSEEIRNYILPVEAAVEHLKKIIVKDSAVFSIASGSPVYSTGISKLSKGISEKELVAVLTLKGELIAIANANMDSDGMMKKKGLAAKTDRVVINKKLYQR